MAAAACNLPAGHDRPANLRIAASAATRSGARRGN
jgi:hypothetical protein